jgi:Protein of unknown function (DUF3027).
LSPEGRDAAATRWYDGESGPKAEIALKATARCSTCGYFVPMAGALRAVFGVCANEWSPSDGRVVSLDHGCGAHSETDIEQPEPTPIGEPIVDELAVDVEQVLPVDPDVEPPADPTPEGAGEPAPEVVHSIEGATAVEGTGEETSEDTAEGTAEDTGERD